MVTFGIPEWSPERVVDLYACIDSEEKIAERKGHFAAKRARPIDTIPLNISQLRGQDPLTPFR